MAVGTGKIEVNESDNYCTWEVLTERGNKLGFISAKIRRKLRYSPQVSTEQTQSQIVSISSIIGNFFFTQLTFQNLNKKGDM